MKRRSVILLALVALLCLCLAACGKPADVTEPPETTLPPEEGITLYYNVNRDQIVEGMLVRTKSDEGLYRIRLSANGDQKDYFTKDKVLIDQMDNSYIFGLAFDEEGYITAVYHPEEITGGYLVEDFFVTAVNGNEVNCNSSAMGDGLPVTFTLQENTKVFNVGGSGLLVGIPGTVNVEDAVTAVKDIDGNVTHVFVTPYKEPGTIYWNIEKMYNSTLKVTTRPTDLVGRYEYKFMVEGEEVTYYTKDSDIANAIDGVAAKCMGLAFDEEGNIIDVLTVKEVCGGNSIASWYNVTEIKTNGEVYFERIVSGSNQGATASAFLSKNCKIYDMTEFAEPFGGETELRVGDMVHCLRDGRGRICYIFVVGSRTSGADMYWNLERNWNKTTKQTNRKPKADGYYHFLMAVNGKQINVRVKDLETANAIESPVCVGLKLDENNIVTGVYPAKSVYGGNVFGSYCYITKLDGKEITCYKKDTDTTYVGNMAEDCVIYNVSDLASTKGEKISSVRVGDLIQCYRNTDNKIAIIYVISRESNGPVYWNVERQWDSNNKVSTRTPDADGYYYFTMAASGKQVTLKSKSKTIANQVDERTCVVLVTSGSTITKVLAPTKTTYTGGGLFGTNCHVTAIDGNKITVEKMSGSDKGTTYTGYMTSGCDIYDVSKTAETVGQKTTLHVGDQINAFVNSSKRLTLIYVLASSNHDAHTCDCCGQDVKWIAWNGTTTMSDGGHYCASGSGNIYIQIDPGATVTLCLNGMSLNARSYAFKPIPAGVTVNVVDCKDTGHIHGSSGKNASIALVNGGTMNIYGGTYTGVEVAEAGKSGGLFSVAGGGTLNMYGGKISGGKSTASAGNVNITDGTFTLYDGIIEGGTAATYGGNIALNNENAKLIIKGGSVLGGTAETHGAGIAAFVGALTVEGGTIDGEISVSNSTTAELLGGTLSGGVVHSGTTDVTLGGNVQISTLQLAGEGGMTLSAEKPLAGAVVGLSTMKNGVILAGITQTEAACFTLQSPGTMTYVPTPDTEVGDLVIEAPHSHCFCEGGENLPSDHVCDETVVWQAITGTTTVSEDSYLFLDWTGGKGAAITVADNVKAHLCLNGASIYARTTITLGEGSSLTVCDCSVSKTGKIAVSSSSTRGPVLMDKAATLALYGGTITGDMNGKLFSAVTVANADAVVNIYGGTITGSAEKNVNLTAGKLLVLGGEVNDIFVGADGELTAGNAALGNVYLSDGKTIAVTADFDPEKASVGVTMEDSADPIVVGIDKDISGAFTSTGGQPVVFETDKLVLGVAPHTHCWCVNAEVKPEGHACVDTQGWTPYTAGMTMVDGGHYYLTEDTASKLTLPSGEISLCLNGYTLSSGTQIMASFSAGKTVNICDCGEGGTIRGKLNSAAPVGVVSGGTLNLYSGTLTANKVTASNKNGGILTMTGGAVNMYGGAIAGGNTTGNGGNLNISTGVFSLYGGKISDGTAAKYGGSVAVTSANGDFRMYGGTISGGTAGTHGGAVGVGFGKFTLYGGYILGGNANTNGGTMSANNTSVVTLLGGVVGTGNAIANGDSVYSGKSNVVLGGDVQIADIYLHTDAVLALSTEKALTGSKTIGITAPVGVAILTTETDVSGVFVSNTEGYIVTFAEGALTLTEGQEIRPAPVGIRLLDEQGREVEDTLTLNVGETLTLTPIADPVTAAGITATAEGVKLEGWTLTAETEGTATVVLSYEGTPLRTLTITITAL